MKPSRLKAPALSSQTLCSQATAVRLVSHSAGYEEAGPISDRKKRNNPADRQNRRERNKPGPAELLSTVLLSTGSLVQNYPEGKTHEHRTQSGASGITGNNV